MNAKLKQVLKFSIPQRLLFARDSLLAPKATRLLLVSDGDAYCSEQQLAPFHAHRSALRERMNLVFHHRALDEVLADPAAALKGADAVGLKLSFRTPPQEATRITSVVAQHKEDGPLIYFDGDDDSVIQWPAILPMVDLIVKKHVFRDPADYQREFVGRSNLTDYVARHHGWDFRTDPVPASTPVDPRLLDRLHLGYNVALDDKIVELYRRTKKCWSDPHRPNDIVCRATVTGWLGRMREGIAPALSDLEGRYKIIVPTQRVDQETYDRELSTSKICVSPLGYGEICWRDFEAVLWGCLMVKPRMDGILTKPDIFVPGETYVPVSWDLSDLSQKCAYYLEHEEERLRIVRQAYATLSSFYEEERFFDEVAEILAKAKRSKMLRERESPVPAARSTSARPETR